MSLPTYCSSNNGDSGQNNSDPDSSNPDSSNGSGQNSDPQGGIDSVTGLANKFAWLKKYVQSGESYTIEVNSNESISSQILGKSNTTITLQGVGPNRIITLSGILMLNEGVTLILDKNITLQCYGGLGVEREGILIMNPGSTIAGNSKDAVLLNRIKLTHKIVISR